MTGAAPHIRRGCAFFDRDGTLTVDKGYTFKPEDLRWQPGAIEAIRLCNDEGRFVIVVTNQSGIARGFYTERDVDVFHRHMQDELRTAGAHIDAFYYCPYHGEGSVSEFAIADHPDRKPNPGMLRRALQEWPIDIDRSFLVGDSKHDIAAAAAVSIAGLRVAPGELVSAVRSALSRPTPTRTDSPDALLRARAAAAREWLFEHALPLWRRQGFDARAGCFHERLTPDGEGMEGLDRRIRVQARQTIVFARAAKLGWNGPWREMVEAGARVLLERGLRPDGGTHYKLAPDGRLSDNRRDLYDLAFVVFALAEAGAALDRSDTISVAEALADWAFEHWAHPHGGFQEGEIVATPPRRQNPHMHMFEAMLSLYSATKDAKHLERASAIARLFSQKFFNTKFGALPEYYLEDWANLSGEEGRISEPGHQFEWCWLLHRWRALGGGDLSEQAERLRIHAEVYGVDHGSGVIFDETFLDGRVRLRSSRLWPYCERLKASLVRYRQSGDESAARNAAQAFDILMRFCDNPTKGVWRDNLASDASFAEQGVLASSFYHIIFALEELIRFDGN